MSKYIRTKDGTICDDGNNYIIDEEGNYCEVRTFMGKSEEIIMIPKNNIEKESDNLEDLFDGYVTYDVNNGYDFFTKKGWDETYPFEDDLKEEKNNTLWVMNNRPDLKPALYGAIWTDKGLIYVAKLNKNGEWELI